MLSMRNIILASNSRARKELLRRCGFKFKVAVSGASELKYRYPARVSRIAIQNALLKARSISRKFKTGVIIGADTIVLQDKKAFGKPRDKREAFLMIKKLSRNPCYAYTGLAVIDIDNHKVYQDYAKTKVWMAKMPDEDIKKYLACAKARQFNFAGGFDIQGKGSIFIERIEGCFYNVVGLPLAKLYKLLKKCAITI